MNTVKANQKAILIVGILIINCILGSVILYSKETKVEEDNSDIKLLSLNDALVYEESDLLMIDEVEEEELEPEIVYDGMTLDELAHKLNKSLKNELSGKGMLIASYSLDNDADPYIVTAIMLHETGCNWNCSRLVKECNNVGGKKGSGCGSYQYYESLEDGIKNLINYLSKNYFKKGLDTPKEINQKYASDQTWYKKINNYVKQIKNA